MMIGRARFLLLPAIALTLVPGLLQAGPQTHRVWQKVEITLSAANAYDNPYRDVSVWVDLTGPGLRKRCHGFWDGGLWGGNVEPVAKTHIWDVIQWESGAQMRHLAAFVLSQGREYQKLVPHAELVQPNRSGPPRDFVGWAYCARTDDQRLFLLYFERDCPPATLAGASVAGRYEVRWFNPRTGAWTDGGTLAADGKGGLQLPAFPDGGAKSHLDWAVKLILAPGR